MKPSISLISIEISSILPPVATLVSYSLIRRSRYLFFVFFLILRRICATPLRSKPVARCTVSSGLPGVGRVPRFTWSNAACFFCSAISASAAAFASAASCFSLSASACRRACLSASCAASAASCASSARRSKSSAMAWLRSDGLLPISIPCFFALSLTYLFTMLRRPVRASMALPELTAAICAVGYNGFTDAAAAVDNSLTGNSAALLAV